MMLQVALLLLASGLCRHMWSINAPVAYILIGLTGLGVVFYVAIVIAGTSSYACPFQTPASIALRGPWKRFRNGIISCVIHSKHMVSWTHRLWNRGTTAPLENIQVHQSEPWLKPKELDIIRRANTGDVRCVSWILRSITDPEALDAAIRLAGTIRWFDDGINVDPPYDLVVSTFEACFDSTGKLHPGSRDRAYHSGQATIWIRTLGMCKSKELASIYPLPDTDYIPPGLDDDLRHLLISMSQFANPHREWLLELDTRDTPSRLPLADFEGRNISPDLPWVDFETRDIPPDLLREDFDSRDTPSRLPLLDFGTRHTPSHLQWVSDVLLHLSWTNQSALDHKLILGYISTTRGTKTTVPLNATLNRLLVWCIVLGSPVEEEALKIQDKSYDISCVCSSSYSRCPSPAIA